MATVKHNIKGIVARGDGPRLEMEVALLDGETEIGRMNVKVDQDALEAIDAEPGPPAAMAAKVRKLVREAVEAATVNLRRSLLSKSLLADLVGEEW